MVWSGYETNHIPHSFTKFIVTSKPMVWYEYGTIYMGLLILYGLGMGLFIWSGYETIYMVWVWDCLYGLGMRLRIYMVWV